MENEETKQLLQKLAHLAVRNEIVLENAIQFFYEALDDPQKAKGSRGTVWDFLGTEFRNVEKHLGDNPSVMKNRFPELFDEPSPKPKRGSRAGTKK